MLSLRSVKKGYEHAHRCHCQAKPASIRPRRPQHRPKEYNVDLDRFTGWMAKGGEVRVRWGRRGRGMGEISERILYGCNKHDDNGAAHTGAVANRPREHGVLWR